MNDNSTAAITMRTYVEYLYPGAMFPETSAHLVNNRDPERTAREAPDNVFAFRFFDRATAIADVDGEEIQLSSPPVRETGRYYIDAEELTARDIAELPGDYTTLLRNMQANNWPVVLHCRAGNYQPFTDGDSVVSSREN